jgi:hypothetical protein
MDTENPAYALARFRSETTHQLTTFNRDTRSKTVAIPRGQRVGLPEVTGPGVLTQLWITFPGWFWQHWNPDAPIAQSILKTLILRIYWDGATAAAVEAPVGDFFGNGLCEGANFTSRYFGMSSGGFFCKFPMPFRTGFRIELENRDPTVDTDVFVNALYQVPETPPVDCGYFHAQFRTGTNPGSEPVTILEAAGRGHYVGCTLAMEGQARHYLSFLEAPEYITLDGDEASPRVGTGLEDYFLGGWYFREGTFTGELHGVPTKDALNSRVAMYRAHDADAIRFQKRIRFAFVNPWQPERLKPFAWSSAAFCYLDSPAGQGAGIPAAEALLCWKRIRDTDRLSVP